jgi:hypothetical protein
MVKQDLKFLLLTIKKNQEIEELKFNLSNYESINVYIDLFYYDVIIGTV